MTGGSHAGPMPRTYGFLISDFRARAPGHGPYDGENSRSFRELLAETRLGFRQFQAEKQPDKPDVLKGVPPMKQAASFGVVDVPRVCLFWSGARRGCIKGKV